MQIYDCREICYYDLRYIRGLFFRVLQSTYYSYYKLFIAKFKNLIINLM